MPSKTSAGLLMYRVREGNLEVFLAHPGGPYHQGKDEGHWTIPKGGNRPNEPLLVAAIREFQEEIGFEARGEFLELGSIRQKAGKIVHAWGFEGDCPAGCPIASNHFLIEWPPHSGKMQSFPEIDRAQFFSLDEARHKIKEAQRPLLDRLELALKSKLGKSMDGRIGPAAWLPKE